VAKRAETLRAIFAEPIRSNIDWPDIEAMLDYFGATMSEGSDARLRVWLGGTRAVFDRQRGSVASKTMIRSIRRFLTSAGIEG
jgi:hypothetical protein